jgi:hypothetical protein
VQAPGKRDTKVNKKLHGQDSTRAVRVEGHR